jgi:hypothetical protein
MHAYEQFEKTARRAGLMKIGEMLRTEYSAFHAPMPKHLSALLVQLNREEEGSVSSRRFRGQQRRATCGRRDSCREF